MMNVGKDRAQVLESIIAQSSSSISPNAAAQLRNLLSSAPPAPPPVSFPASKLAGVLILLFVNEQGELSVILTTRSMTLRSHPGETCLPGGRFETSDESIEATALREANEEIGLPLYPSSSLLYLATLPAFTSRTLLVVIPSVYLLTTLPASAVLDRLVKNESEVDEIFYVELSVFLGLENQPAIPLDASARRTRSNGKGQPIVTHTHQDFEWLSSKLYRLHHFSSPSFPNPITGLTADILITAALIAVHSLSEKEDGLENGEGRKRLGYERRAKGQMSWSEIVVVALASDRRLGDRGLKDDQRSSVE